MRLYESVIIVNSSLHEDTLNRIISHCEDVITKNGGKLRFTDKWGKRRLAYPIKKFQYGYYVLFDFEAPTNLIIELERDYRLNENILRFMNIQKDKRAILAEQRKKEEEEKIEAQVAAQIDEEPELSEETPPEVMTEGEVLHAPDAEPASDTEPSSHEEPGDATVDITEEDLRETAEESKKEESEDTTAEMAAEPEEALGETTITETEEEQAPAADSDSAVKDVSNGEEPAKNNHVKSDLTGEVNANDDGDP